MNIIINGKAFISPKETMTVEELLCVKDIPRKATAIAVNGRICKADEWATTMLKNGDSITVISAAFGG